MHIRTQTPRWADCTENDSVGLQPSRAEYEDIQDADQLHDVIIGSDDEMDSVLSGPMSDHSENPRESSSLLNDSRRSSVGNH